MKALFWVCVAQVAYTYFGYPIALAIYASVRRIPLIEGQATPTVSIVIAAKNEQANLLAKLHALRSIEYPPDRLQVIVASDGSSDETAAILRHNEPFVIPVIIEQSRGKAHALDMAVEKATGEILVFQDARQIIDPSAVAELVACFADPSIGAASGELLLEDASDPAHPTALGAYWKLEKAIRKLESASGSVVGVTGALYAVRRELFARIPAGTILDDLFVPMSIVKRGYRVVFQAKAIARDQIFPDRSREFARKVRTLTGNYQLLRLAPWLLSFENPLLFRFVSHKLLRLLVPLSLVLMLLSSAAGGSAFYRAIFLLQIAFYATALLGWSSTPAKRLKLVSVANTFVILNVAAVMAFYNFISHKENVWV
jgi:poly-beta-1,6-N-acetyl-D-glucosamine synthase